MTVLTNQRFALATVVAALVVASTASAQSLKLSELLGADRSAQSGDKLFRNFTYSATGDMPMAEDVNVIPIVDDDGNYGIRFQGGFIDHPGGGASDVLITFDVAVMPASGMLISDAHLSMDGAVVEGAGLASVTETFLPLVTDGSMSVFSAGPESNTPPKLVDWIYFEQPFEVVSVQKDILLLAGTGVVTVSSIDQTFSQVPEPAAGLMSLAGLLGCAMARRRRRDA